MKVYKIYQTLNDNSEVDPIEVYDIKDVSRIVNTLRYCVPQLLVLDEEHYMVFHSVDGKILFSIKQYRLA